MIRSRAFWLGAVLLGVAGVFLLGPWLLHGPHHAPPAQALLRRMVDGAKAYYSTERSRPSGDLLAPDLPPSAPAAPQGPLCPHATPDLSHPTWDALHLPATPGLRVRFERKSPTRFVARVNGDADCDGVESTFERHCQRDGDAWQCAPFSAAELE